MVKNVQAAGSPGSFPSLQEAKQGDLKMGFIVKMEVNSWILSWQKNSIQKRTNSSHPWCFLTHFVWAGVCACVRVCVWCVSVCAGTYCSSMGRGHMSTYCSSGTILLFFEKEYLIGQEFTIKLDWLTTEPQGCIFLSPFSWVYVLALGSHTLIPKLACHMDSGTELGSTASMYVTNWHGSTAPYFHLSVHTHRAW